MNPGSSQFNAQFPDVEEAMESKKLQTVNAGGWLAEAGQTVDGKKLRATVLSVYHDARIAHELMDDKRTTPETPLESRQRELIQQLAEALSACYGDLNAFPRSLGMNFTKGAHLAKSALTAAAPFLED